jgi:hypothetical protein
MNSNSLLSQVGCYKRKMKRHQMGMKMVGLSRKKIEKCSKNIEIKSKKYSIKSIKRNQVGLYLERLVYLINYQTTLMNKGFWGFGVLGFWV